MLSYISPADIIMKLTKINKIKIAGTWYLSEINTKTLKMLKNLNINIT